MINEKLKSIVILLCISVFSACGQENTSNVNSIHAVEEKNYSNKNIIDWQFVGVGRCFDLPIENSSVEYFKTMKVQFSGNTITLNGKDWVVFTESRIKTTQNFGKGTVYEYFIKYVKENYHIDASEYIHSINLSFEDATRIKSFKPFFVKYDAVYTGEYLFLYSNDDYLVTFKRAFHQSDSGKNRSITSIISSEKLVQLPFDYVDFADKRYRFDMGEIDNDSFPTYQMDNNPSFKSLYTDKWASDTIPWNYYVFNTPLTNCKVFLVICDIKSNYTVYMLVTYNIQTGDLERLDLFPFKTKQPTSFSISKNLKVNFYDNTFKGDSLINQKLTATYQIQDDGKIIRVASSQ